jgi:FkbM family methyltransferase
MDRHFRPGDTFFDVGANIGLYSLYAALRMERRGLVYAFEPEALNHAKLNRNTHLNGLSGLVLPLCIAVSDTLAVAPLNIHPLGLDLMDQGAYVPGAAMHCFGSTRDFEGKDFTPFHVQMMLGVPLDRLCYELGLPTPAHLKIDVDGHEGKVLAGADRLLRDPGLRTLLVEITFTQGEHEDFYKTLRQAGFAEESDYPEHSDQQLAGTRWAGTGNRIFVRA